MAKQNFTIFQRLTKTFGLNGGKSQPSQSFSFDKEELLKTDSKEDYANALLQAQQSKYIADKWAKIDQSIYNQSVYYEPNRLSAYYDYESMEFSIHGDTKIATPNGFITIKELADKGRDYEFIVYAYDHNQKKVVPAIARNAHFTRNEMTYKITFDDDSYIIATYGHRFLKRNGEFCVVEELKEGDSMMPFYRKSLNKDENLIYSCNNNEGDAGWVNENDLIKKLYVDKLNINEVVRIVKEDQSIVKTAKKLNISTEKLKNELRFNGFKSWDDFLNVYKIKKSVSEDRESINFEHIPWDLIIKTAKECGTTQSCADKLNISISKLTSSLRMNGFKNWGVFMEAYGMKKSKAGRKKVENVINHKIVSIEPFGVVPVYDLTVPGYKNFATDTIFSHNTPEISAALDIYAEESTVLSERGDILTITSESTRIKEVLSDLFNNVLDINTNLQMWARGMCKYGDDFVYLKIDQEKGIIGCHQLPNIEISRNEGSAQLVTKDEINKKELKFEWKQKSLEFQAWEIAHFRLLSDDRKLPYGSSMLDKIRRIWKQLLLAEDAMLIYRTSRAPERRVFKVFVGNMDDADVEQYVQRVAGKFKRDAVVDSRNGQVDTRYNQMAVDQDYFIPVRDPSAPSPIETLPGACISLETEIPLLDGRTLKLNDIINEWDNGNRDIWVYSVDSKSGKVAPGMVTWAGITRKNTEVMKITLDNGKEIIATPDHKFVHRTNGFIEAKDLNVGDSLMPFYTQKKNNKEQVWDNKENKWLNNEELLNNLYNSLISDFKNIFNILSDDILNKNNIKRKKLISNYKKYISKKNKEEFYNHKIVSIEYLEEKMDTGTITVDGNEIYHDYHTFATSAGVFIKNSNLGEIADIEYIQKKLLAALRIPKAFLGFEEVVGDGKNLALMDIRFARTINRIQKALIQELNKIALIHLYILGFEDELHNFSLSLTNPSAQSDLLRIEAWKEKITLYKDATSDQSQVGILPVSHTWAKKNILGMSDSEIILDLQQQRLERAIGNELTQLTPQIIKRSGIFDDVDKKYGIPEEEREKIEKGGTQSGSQGVGPELGMAMNSEPISVTQPSNEPPLSERKKPKPILNEDYDALFNFNKAKDDIYEIENKLKEILND